MKSFRRFKPLLSVRMRPPSSFTLLIIKSNIFFPYFVGGTNGPTDGDDEVFAVSIDRVLLLPARDRLREAGLVLNRF